MKPALSSARRPVNWVASALLVLAWETNRSPAAPAPLPFQTNLTVTVTAANLTGQSQRYEDPQIRILQGLKPDIAALQEFRYGDSSATELRAFVDLAFGPDFFYSRESSATESYAIPNGIVSRFPIVESGCWDDVTIPDRGFAWARIRLPGTNDLYVVSVHFKASGGSENVAKRMTEASNLVALIQASFPAGAWVMVAGDLNTGSRAEASLATLQTIFSDEPIPTDATIGGNDKTNLDRDRPYDYVLASFSMTNRLAPVEIGGQSFSNGLVLDSRVFAPLEALPPIQPGDSTNGQHMAVMKGVKIGWLTTNWIDLPRPCLKLVSHQRIEWTGPSNLVFRVQTNASLDNSNGWITAAVITSPTTNFSSPVHRPETSPLYYRVTCP